MKKELIFEFLRQLGIELDNMGLTGEILLAGGAAMCLVHSARDMTKDIDALYEPKNEINEIAVKIADYNGLPRDWLNDSVKGFLTHDAPSEEFICFKGLNVRTVTADYLLAMKLIASRYGETDIGDVRFLFKKLGIATYEQACEIIIKYFNPESILPRTMYVIESILAETNCEC